MQRQRGELVPIGEALGGLPGPVKALRAASPQARHHFTQADQVDQLITASEADPDLGFMARTMALCAPKLPRQPVSVSAGEWSVQILSRTGHNCPTVPTRA